MRSNILERKTVTGLSGLKNLFMVRLYNKKRFGLNFLLILTKFEKPRAIIVKYRLSNDVITDIIE